MLGFICRAFLLVSIRRLVEIQKQMGRNWNYLPLVDTPCPIHIFPQRPEVSLPSRDSCPLYLPIVIRGFVTPFGKQSGSFSNKERRRHSESLLSIRKNISTFKVIEASLFGTTLDVGDEVFNLGSS